MGAVEEGLVRISGEGTRKGLLSAMRHRSRLYGLLRYGSRTLFEKGVSGE